MAVNQSDRREHILEAAFECFLRFGYAKTSMADIARECELSRSLLYLHFKTKEEIFGAVLSNVFERSHQRAMEVMARRSSRRDKLMAVLEVKIFALWERLIASPHADELFAQGHRIYPSVAATDRRRSVELLSELIGDVTVTEIFLLAVKGLESDRPSLKVLRARCEQLVDLVLKRR